MNMTTIVLCAAAIALIMLLTWIWSPERSRGGDWQQVRQVNANGQAWCNGCEAWAYGSVEHYWYHNGNELVLAQLCPDCALERHADLASEDSIPMERYR